MRLFGIFIVVISVRVHLLCFVFIFSRFYFVNKAVPVFEGEVLTFHKITRSEMGAYLCSKSASFFFLPFTKEISSFLISLYSHFY